MDIKARLMSAGVRNLKEYGYPDVSSENILSDSIYKEFFRSMLNDNLGFGFDTEINQLLSEIVED